MRHEHADETGHKQPPLSVFERSYWFAKPRDNSTRYIGSTSGIHRRYAQHILGTNGAKTAKYERVKSLKQEDLVPTLDVLESGIKSRYQAEEREAYWIRFYRGSGAMLTNRIEPHPIHTPPPLNRKRGPKPSSMASTTQLRQLRESLGATQEAVARRTRSISLRT
jgi:predicted GIY-YIG superfamily endonuclease